MWAASQAASAPQVGEQQEKTDSGRPSIYKSVICNTSKEMTAYSDFPFPDHYPNNVHNSRIVEYLRMYTKHFNLMKYIQFLLQILWVMLKPLPQRESRVDSASKKGVLCPGGDENKVDKDEAWVRKQNIKNWSCAVVVNNRDDRSGRWLKKFKGQYMHSWEYKIPEKFQGKRIIVIGIGNSAADLAIELSHVAAQVFLSTRRGTWIWSRVWDNGMPVDTVLLTHFNSVLNKLYTTFLINRWAENKLNARFNHDIYSLQPQHRFLSYQNTLSDDLPNHIISGRVLITPNVREFTETSAIFEDGTEEDIDVVIFATGYNFSFPFLENNVLDSQLSMFKYVFPPQLEKPTLAFIGTLQPAGAIIPISELQSRWAVRVFKASHISLEQSVFLKMWDVIHHMNEGNFLNSPRTSRKVQYIDYMDELASEIGVEPNLFSLFLWDPKLAMEVFFGPCTPYQYRLQGPGKWDGAQRAILTQKERTIKPLRTRILSCGHSLCHVCLEVSVQPFSSSSSLQSF
ncbi:LOW QUALITY PROTEIN: flavin-containing monooxygenase 5-like [Dugong dugon]